MLHSSLRKLAFGACLSGILALSGCHKKTMVPPPSPPPVADTTQPTASITASPNVIDRGQSTVLNWKTTDASTASISGIGPVPANGTQNVSPRVSTTFTITATGPGGVGTASAEVTVNREVPPAPMASTPASSNLTEEQLFEHNIKDIYFDYDRYNLQPEDSATIQQDATFLQQHSGLKIVIEGRCDDRGSEEYNLALGQDRALAVKEALLTDGISGSRIEIISLGKEKPFCTTDDDACWHENRRAHFRLADR